MRLTRRGCSMVEFRLETGRLILRSWQDNDRVPFAAMSADAEVMEYLDGVTDAAASDALIDRLRGEEQAHGFTMWAVEQKDGGAFLGFCGLRRGGHPGTGVEDELEIGWRLARRAWGQGFAREAAEASLAWGWGNRADRRIVAWTVQANTASWGLMLRLGMEHRPDLDFDHPRFAAGHPLRRHIVYTIARPDR
jgi:RimJ/RimL family protein N-acetyltransferase